MEFAKLSEKSYNTGIDHGHGEDMDKQEGVMKQHLKEDGQYFEGQYYIRNQSNLQTEDVPNTRC